MIELTEEKRAIVASFQASDLGRCRAYGAILSYTILCYPVLYCMVLYDT